MKTTIPKLKIWLDDVRPEPEGWTRTLWPHEVIELLKTNDVECISLDHDLGDDERGTGYDVLTWIEEEVVISGFEPPKIRIHTANPVAYEKMKSSINSIYRFVKMNNKKTS